MITHLGTGGPSTVVQMLVDGLSKRGVETYLIVLNCGHDYKYAHFLDDEYCLHITPRLSGIIKGCLRLRKLRTELRLDLLHSHGIIPDLLNVITAKKMATVTTVHNNRWHDYANVFGRVVGWPLAIFHGVVFAVMGSVVCCSASVRSSLCIPTTRRCEVVRNGVPQGAVLSNPCCVKEERERVNFVSVGSLSVGKGIRTLAHGFSTFRTPNEYLTIVGDGELFSELVSAQLEGVTFVGRKDDVLPYLTGADFYVSNSSTEGFPMAVLEGLSVGLVPILSAIPAHQELIDLVPAGSIFDHDDIATMLKLSRNSQRSRSIRGDLQSAQMQHFSDRSMVEGYIQVYVDMIGDNDGWL